MGAVLKYAGLLSLVSLLGCTTVRELWGGDREQLHEHGQQGDRCHTISNGNALHPVKACEKGDAYRFAVLGHEVSYTKEQFRDYLRQHLLYFLRGTSYPWQTLAEATVAIWVAAPVFAPSHTFLIASIDSPGGNFYVTLDIHMNRWEVGRDNLLLLGKESYPSRKAKRVGQLALLPQAHIPRAYLSPFLKRCQIASSMVDSSGPTVIVRTRPFEEGGLAKCLMTLPQASQYFRHVAYIPAQTTAADKKKVFSFPFLKPENPEGDHP